MYGRGFWSGIAVAASLVVSSVPTSAASLFELLFYLPGPRFDGVLPACNANDALYKVAALFREKEALFWQSNLEIVGYENLREIAFRPWAPNAIPRRFCSGVVVVSDGLRHPIHYSIAEDSGWLGATWGLQLCVVGLDRNWAYNPGCKQARP